MNISDDELSEGCSHGLRDSSHPEEASEAVSESVYAIAKSKKQQQNNQRVFLFFK